MGTFIFEVPVTRILVSPQPVLSNNSLYNDMCIFNSYKTKLHVLAFIPCRADDIHGHQMSIVWPCTWFMVHVGFITEYYIDIP